MYACIFICRGIIAPPNGLKVTCPTAKLGYVHFAHVRPIARKCLPHEFVA